MLPTIIYILKYFNHKFFKFLLFINIQIKLMLGDGGRFALSSHTPPLNQFWAEVCGHR